jgi:uncharacterized protein (TIGR02452 family)
MYGFHRSNYDPLYTNYGIYSPQVPVFRADDGGQLLEKPYPLSIITSPAVNAAQLDAARHGEIAPAMWQRNIKVLAIGVLHGHDSIVLGAWGCGAFGYDPNEIAAQFERALRNNSNHDHGATITKRVSLESDKRLERLEPLEPLELPGPACCLPPNSVHSNRSF